MSFPHGSSHRSSWLCQLREKKKFEDEIVHQRTLTEKST